MRKSSRIYQLDSRVLNKIGTPNGLYKQNDMTQDQDSEARQDKDAVPAHARLSRPLCSCTFYDLIHLFANFREPYSLACLQYRILLENCENISQDNRSSSTCSMSSSTPSTVGASHAIISNVLLPGLMNIPQVVCIRPRFDRENSMPKSKDHP